MFKKTKIAAATVALLSAAAMQNASAVAIDESGTNAQVLIFPYYNTNGSFQSAFNIRNTTNTFKVVKVRFRESKLSNDVLDFNVYLSPYDHFSGTIGKNAAGNASFSTSDTTCTDPAIPTGGVQLLDTLGTGKSPYTNTTFDDAREGYIEVIEMGNVNPVTKADNTGVVSTSTVTAPGTGTIIAGIKHASGKPANCGTIATAWASGAFAAGSINGMIAPNGGLQGWSFLLDVAQGNANVAMPVAIRNYTTAVQHYQSGDQNNYLLPSLASGNNMDSNVVNDAGTGMVTTTWSTAVDFAKTTTGKAEIAPNTTLNSGTNPYPIAHVLAATAISNDYLVTESADNAAGTDWVITLPMRKHGIYSYQDATATNGDVNISGAAFYNREEDSVVVSKGFSPVTQTPAQALPREVNILSFGKGGVAANVLGSKNAKPYSVNYATGWGQITLSGDNGYTAAATATTPKFVEEYNITKTFKDKVAGVPVIGFAAVRGNFAPGAQNVIGESIPHVLTRSRGN